MIAIHPWIGEHGDFFSIVIVSYMSILSEEEIPKCVGMLTTHNNGTKWITKFFDLHPAIRPLNYLETRATDEIGSVCLGKAKHFKFIEFPKLIFAMVPPSSTITSFINNTTIT